MLPGRISAYGKLPWAGDFLQVGSISDAPQLVEWLEVGVALGDARGPAWTQAFDSGAQKGFVLQNGSAGHVAGVIAPSWDAVGRRFPFVVFTPLPVEVEPAVSYVAPLVLGAFLHTAGMQIEAARNQRVDLNAVAAGIAPPDPSSLTAHLEGYSQWSDSASLRVAGQAMFGANWRERISYALYIALESIRPFYGQDSPPTQLSIRFPVGAGLSGAAAFWLQVTRACAGWQRTIPDCVWSFDPERASITIFSGRLSKQSFADLWEPRPQSDDVSDLVAGGSFAPELLATVRPDLANLLLRDDVSVSALLAAIPPSS